MQLFQQQNKPLAGKATLPITASPAYPQRFPPVSAPTQAAGDGCRGKEAFTPSCVLGLPSRGKPPSQGEKRKKREAQEQGGWDSGSRDLGRPMASA